MDTIFTGSALQFNLYKGGHVVPAGWAEEAVMYFEKVIGPKQG